MQRLQITEDAENAFKRTRGCPPTRLKKKPLMNENRIAIKENDDKKDDVKPLETNTKTEEDPPALVSPLQSCKTSPASSDLHLPRTWLKVSCDSLITMKCPEHEGPEVPVTDLSSPPEEKLTEMASKNADTFEAGTLVWAFMSGYPLWPAIVTSNADENTHIRQKKMKNCVVNFYHVQFFGDSGRHSWISKCRLLLFSNGQKGLKETARNLEPSIANNKKFMVALQLSVKGNRGGPWDVALKEAMACDQFRTPSERLDHFFSLIKKPRTERKRKLSTSSMQNVDERLKGPVEGSKEFSNTEEEQAHPKSTKLPKKFKKESREFCCGSCSQTFSADFDFDLLREDALCPQCILLSCFICKRNEATRLLEKCTLSDCIYSYHKECMAAWPSATTRENGKESPCPVHYCHNCSRLWKQNVAEGELRQHKKLIRCVLCPTAFHNECLAAGCLRISSTKIICYRHGKSWKTPTPVHVNWCFMCSKGGKLLCCDQCPASFHLDCLNLPSEPNGAYLCKDCESGSMINMGDIVWVKIGFYRWWPARVPLVEEIPEHLAKKIKVPGEFLVRFYGSHDYAVVHRGQAFHYQEGDTGGKDTSKGSLAVRFQKAIEEAAVGYREREKLLNERSAVLVSSVKTKPAPYKRIKSNQYVGKVRPPPEASSTPCDCKTEMPGPCGPNSNCINRLLLIECNPAMCPAGEKCENQRLQKRQYPALHIFRTNSKGWGLKTSVDIKRGELVIEYVGEVIDELELKKRLKIRHEAREESFYFLTLDSNRVIDAGPKGNLARFMNHSCSPNCESQKWTVQGDTRIGLFALTDISAGTELTFNYQLECAVLEGEESRNKQPCLCGALNCSGFIGAKPKPIKENIVKENKVKAVKKKRKNPKQKKLEDAEDLCFSCGDGGDLILCDTLTCNKVYHLECLSLSAPPKGAWTCPWHHCDVCGKKSSVVCSVCPSSVCGKHADSLSIRDDPRFGPVCREHNEDFLAIVMEDRQKRSGKTCQKV